MLPGRKLIIDIEKILSEIDADEWKLSQQLEHYIMEGGDDLLRKWRDIKNNHSKRSARNQRGFLFDAIQSEVFFERKKLQGRVDYLDDVDDDLDGLIASA